MARHRLFSVPPLDRENLAFASCVEKRRGVKKKEREGDTKGPKEKKRHGSPKEENSSCGVGREKKFNPQGTCGLCIPFV
jgi:hypothetical protein